MSVVVRAYLLRGTMLWILMRLVLTMMAALAGAPMMLSASTTIALVLLVPLLTFFDITRRGESILMANLGFSLTRVLLIAAAPALIGESLVTILTRIA